MSVIDKLFRVGSSDSSYVTAVVVAAGHSSRMGRDKILLPLGDRPVIAHTLGAFERCDRIDEIIVVTRLESIEAVADICHDYGITKVSRIMVGGETRAQSSLIGVCAASGRADIIAIHDGARPFATPVLIDRVISAAERDSAVAPAVSPTDTVRILNSRDAVISTPDRNLVALIQTPQAFSAGVIKNALMRAVKKELPITDDCSAVEKMGIRVSVVHGEDTNIKLTTAMDVYIAEKILADRGFQE